MILAEEQKMLTVGDKTPKSYLAATCAAEVLTS